MLKPDIKRVADGERFSREASQRLELHKKLKNMYIERGFGDKIIEIDGNYNERLNKALKIADDLIK
jgi:nicotinamide riboside kinase